MEVLDDGDGFTAFGGVAADDGDLLVFFFVSAVAEIHAETVDAGVDHFFELFFGKDGRTDRG